MKAGCKYFVMFCLFFVAITACKNDSKKKTEQDLERKLEVELDTTTQVIRYENTLFSLPSPYQLSILMKQIGTNYNAELLNPADNYSKYTSLFKKAINLGIYGADLGYLNTYQQSPSAIKYFSVIKIMAQDLGLSAALSPDIFERIEDNVNNPDSLLFIMSNTYRDVDIFLKENQRQREGSLVLAGGWIEAMYFLTNFALETNNEKLIQRVGENKQPCENLIKILQPYYNESEAIADLVDNLILLSYDFDAIKTDYKYVEPTTIPEEKLTKVHSKTSAVVSEADLKKLAGQIRDIRNQLIK